MCMEVTKHGITAPPTEESNVIGVDTTEEESHCTARTKGSCRDISRIDTIMTGNGKRSRFEKTSDHCGRDCLFSLVVVVINMKRCVLWCVVSVQMCDASEHSANRTSSGLEIGTVCKLSPLNSILLCCEC